MAVSNSTQRTDKSTEKQVLRRAFDTFYEFDAVDAAKEAEARLRRVKRRTRWIIVTIVAAVVFAGVFITLMQVGVEEVKESQMPTIAERLAAPYELAEQPINLPVAAGMPDIDGFTYANMDYETINPVLRCQLAPHDCELSFGNVPVAEGVLFLEEASEEQIAEAEAAAAAAEAAVTYDENGEPIAPEPVTKDLMVFAELTGLIAGEYSNDETTVRLQVAKFSTLGESRQAMLTMYDYARTIGHVGNHALGVSQTVPYYYASGRGWINFVWMQDETVYAVSTRSWRDLDDVIEKLKALPPVPVMDGLNSG